MTGTGTPVTGATRPRKWTVGRVIAMVIGSILGLVGLVVLAGGGALTWAATTQRDDAGFFHTERERFSAGTYTITSTDLDLGTSKRPHDWGFDLGDLVRVRLRATPAERGVPVFVGIGSSRDVERYLRGVPHEEVRDVDLHPFRVHYRTVNGRGEPTAPGDEGLWVAESSGTASTTLLWEPEGGEWTVVLMNADASRGVAADVSVGVEVRHLWAIVGALLGIGAGLLAGGVALIIVVSHRAARSLDAAAPPISSAPEAVAVPAPRGATPPGPVHLAGRPDEPLSRWLWLVKWVLAIPHFVVLALLWAVMLVLTVIAGVAILITGRFPRRIFDFNVGVLRWTWRVAFYATGALGTDRYPPFTLSAGGSYPATLEVQYPGTLSKGLVLVKWWLLALPHYVVVAIIGTGWWWGTLRFGAGRGWDNWGLWGGGLLGILVLVAAVRLLFTGRYPRDMLDLVVGLNRWVYRVAAYALLMTDEYPPFRLDQGDGWPGDVVPEHAHSGEPAGDHG